MTWNILISAPYIQPVIEEYRYILDRLDGIVELLVPEVDERLSENELLELIDDVDAVVCGDDMFTAKVLESASRLKVISKWGTGVDSIDRGAAERLGIVVCNTPDAFTEAVADSVLGYMLCFARKLPWMDQDIRDNRWEKIQGFSLSEATLGIIGLGNVGKAIAHRARSFGMEILGNDIVEISADFISDSGISMVDKTILLETADFVTLNCDLNRDNRYLIGRPELKMMMPTAYLINAARGPLVNEMDLVWALENHEISGAALDVFEHEPLPHNSRLRSFKNCLLAPHNANSSPVAYTKVHKNTLNNLVLNLT